MSNEPIVFELTQEERDARGKHRRRGFLRGTLFQTVFGPKPVEDIQPGDLLLRPSGKFAEVVVLEQYETNRMYNVVDQWNNIWCTCGTLQQFPRYGNSIESCVRNPEAPIRKPELSLDMRVYIRGQRKGIPNAHQIGTRLHKFNVADIAQLMSEIKTWDYPSIQKLLVGIVDSHGFLVDGRIIGAHIQLILIPILEWCLGYLYQGPVLIRNVEDKTGVATVWLAAKALFKDFKDLTKTLNPITRGWNQWIEPRLTLQSLQYSETLYCPVTTSKKDQLFVLSCGLETAYYVDPNAVPQKKHAEYAKRGRLRAKAHKDMVVSSQEIKDKIKEELSNVNQPA